ncbi:MAG: hypothetical protein FJ276_17675 [Planctomycetes bacterium]|nr:hypothetical protein [Planctomycetota bacterium]
MFENIAGIALEASGSIVVADPLMTALFRVDPLTGNRTVLSSSDVGAGPEFGGARCVAIGNTGSIFVTSLYQGKGAVFRVDPLTGNRTLISSDSVGSGRMFEDVLGIALETNGDILVADPRMTSLFRVDPLSGDRTLLSVNGPGSGPEFVGHVRDVAVAADGSIFVTDAAAVSGRVFEVDPLTGNRNLVSGPESGAGRLFEEVMGIAHTATGDLLVADPHTTALFRIDALTGNRTILSSDSNGSGPNFWSARYVEVVPVPEPATAAIWTVLILTFVALYVRRR